MRCLLIYVTACALLSNLGVLGVSEAVREEGGNSSVNSEEDEDDSTEVIENFKNGQDLYIIKKVVYEIGILTDAGNNSEIDNKTHEQIDLSFYDPIDNGTFVDLSNIPIPVETNVSGVAVTGIVRSNLGGLIFPPNGSVASLNGSNFPLFADKQVRITRNITTLDRDNGASILSGIVDILGLHNLVTPKNNKDNETNSS